MMNESMPAEGSQPSRSKPYASLSDSTVYAHERQLLRMFLMGALTEGNAISDGFGAVTWANPHDTDAEWDPGTLCLTYRDYQTGTRRVTALQAEHISYEELVGAAVDTILTRNEGDFSSIIVHETERSDSSGISWKWIRRQTMIAATICVRNSVTRYIQRQEQRVAEAAATTNRGDITSQRTRKNEDDEDSSSGVH